ncbi:hypothetical protein ACFCVS_01590 [Bacillus altitudinis]
MTAGIGSPHEWRHGGVGTMYKVNSFHCAARTAVNRSASTIVVNANVTEGDSVTFIMRFYVYFYSFSQ